jgi:peptidoglycan hydrolase FlgJ
MGGPGSLVPGLYRPKALTFSLRPPAKLGEIPRIDEIAMMLPPVPPPELMPGHPSAETGGFDREELRAVARELEAGFLAEMLKQAGFGESRQTLGGGAGEDQFASLLRVEHARALAARGGIGLAEQVFEALVARSAQAGGSGT